jgi:rRNA-processing protein FCF1
MTAARPRNDGADGTGVERGGPAVLLDANVLMAPVEADVRVFDELERLVPGATLAVPRAVVDELDRLSGDGGGGQERRAARIGRDLVADHCRVVGHAAADADDAIVELAPDAAYVATSDGALRDRVLDAGVPVVSLRGTHKLAVTHP